MRSRDSFRWIHLGALALVAIGLPWSNFLMSLGQLLLAGNFLIEGIVRRDLGARFKHAFTSPPVLVFLSFYALHVLGLLWTEDMAWGLDLCRILAPMVVFAVILAASPPLDEQDLRALLLVGTASTIASTFACLALRPGGLALTDFRSLSVFISHIRLALLLCMSAFVLVAYWPRSALWQVVHALAIAWSIFFLDQLESIAGLAILIVVGLWAGWRMSSEWRGYKRWSLRASLCMVPLMIIAVLWWCVRDFRSVEPVDLTRLDERSVGGEVYFHDRERPGHENGHLVWINVAYGELERGWTTRSTVPVGGPDAKGHPLSSTLIRYLASLGQHKDSVGMLALSEEDVHRIEQGIPSVMRGRRSALRDRIDEILFELDDYTTTGNPSGYSIAMRLEFWRAGAAIARENWLTGVGTGDTQHAFDSQYERMATQLKPQWRLRAHNEYLTLWISFGAVGFLWAMISWIWPAWRNGAFRKPLFVAWAITFALSCLTDDTSETQAGATFFAFFYCLFVFGRKEWTHEPSDPRMIGRTLGKPTNEYSSQDHQRHAGHTTC